MSYPAAAGPDLCSDTDSAPAETDTDGENLCQMCEPDQASPEHYKRKVKASQRVAQDMKAELITDPEWADWLYGVSTSSGWSKFDGCKGGIHEAPGKGVLRLDHNVSRFQTSKHGGGKNNKQPRHDQAKYPFRTTFALVRIKKNSKDCQSGSLIPGIKYDDVISKSNVPVEMWLKLEDNQHVLDLGTKVHDFLHPTLKERFKAIRLVTCFKRVTGSLNDIPLHSTFHAGGKRRSSCTEKYHPSWIAEEDVPISGPVINHRPFDPYLSRNIFNYVDIRTGDHKYKKYLFQPKVHFRDFHSPFGSDAEGGSSLVDIDARIGDGDECHTTISYDPNSDFVTDKYVADPFGDHHDEPCALLRQRRYKYRSDKVREKPLNERPVNWRPSSAVIDRNKRDREEARCRMNAIELGMQVGTMRNPTEYPCVISDGKLLKFTPTGKYMVEKCGDIMIEKDVKPLYTKIRSHGGNLMLKLDIMHRVAKFHVLSLIHI